MTSSSEVTRTGSLEPDTTYDSMVEGSLGWAALAEADLVELAELKRVIDYFDQPFETVDIDEIEQRWLDPVQAASRNAVVGRDRAHTMVAFAWNRIERSEPVSKIWLDGGVHPALRHQEMERRRLAWQLERAAAWLHESEQDGIDEVICCRHIKASNDRFRATAESVGLRPFRWYVDLLLDFRKDKSDWVSDIGSILVAPLAPDHVEAARIAHNTAFETRPGTKPLSQNDWAEVLNSPECRPDWSWVALDRGEVVGYAVNAVTVNDEDERGGWTTMLGVLPQYRGRGIALSLLQASISSFKEADCLWAGIGVDTENPSSAVDGYGRLGYRPEVEIVLYTRHIKRSTPFPLGLFE